MNLILKQEYSFFKELGKKRLLLLKKKINPFFWMFMLFGVALAKR